MPIITLTSDLGYKDAEIAQLKGTLYSELNHPSIVDISHQIPPFHIAQGAYILQKAYHSFPKGSIHLVAIETEIRPDNKPIVVFLDGHYFICANNGLLSLVNPSIKADKMVALHIPNTKQNTLNGLMTFAKAAAHLARGGKLEIIGSPLQFIKQQITFTPTVNPAKNSINGNVIYIDRYENVVTNIKEKIFKEIQRNRSFEIRARNHVFKKIVHSYHEAIRFDVPKIDRIEDGKQLAIFNSLGFLEIAIYKSNPFETGGASSLLGLKYLDIISIRFY